MVRDFIINLYDELQIIRILLEGDEVLTNKDFADGAVTLMNKLREVRNASLVSNDAFENYRKFVISVTKSKASPFEKLKKVTHRFGELTPSIVDEYIKKEKLEGIKILPTPFYFQHRHFMCGQSSIRMAVSTFNRVTEEEVLNAIPNRKEGEVFFGEVFYAVCKLGYTPTMFGVPNKRFGAKMVDELIDELSKKYLKDEEEIDIYEQLLIQKCKGKGRVIDHFITALEVFSALNIGYPTMVIDGNHFYVIVGYDLNKRVFLVSDPAGYPFFPNEEIRNSFERWDKLLGKGIIVSPKPQIKEVEDFDGPFYYGRYKEIINPPPLVLNRKEREALESYEKIVRKFIEGPKTTIYRKA